MVEMLLLSRATLSSCTITRVNIVMRRLIYELHRTSMNQSSNSSSCTLVKMHYCCIASKRYSVTQGACASLLHTPLPSFHLSSFPRTSCLVLSSFTSFPSFSCAVSRIFLSLHVLFLSCLARTRPLFLFARRLVLLRSISAHILAVCHLVEFARVPIGTRTCRHAHQ